MANGQQLAKINFETFISWKDTQRLDDFKKIIKDGKLSRTEIAKSSGLGKSSLYQNPSIRNALSELEERLRAYQILPALNESTNPSRLKHSKENHSKSETKKISALETQNLELKAQVRYLEERLNCFTELSESMIELGILPR